MFNKKRIEELEKVVGYLRGRVVTLEHSRDRIDEQGHIIVKYGENWDIGFGNTCYMVGEKRVCVKDILEKLLKELGYEIKHEYQSESYTLKKIFEIPERKIKKKKKEGR